MSVPFLGKKRLLFALLALGACGQPEPEAPVDERRQATVVANGVSLNGVWLNGPWLNGPWLNGPWLNGTTFAGTAVSAPTKNGVTINNAALSGTRFQGVLSGATIEGAAFIGARFSGVLADRHRVTLRIDGMQAAAAPNSDVSLYQVRYWITGVSTAWLDLCPGGSAIPVAGRWDATGARIDEPGAFTFSCTNGAIAKCVLLGYKPWLSVTEDGHTRNWDRYTHTFSLRDHHHACTRAIRADYCGNGESNTHDGIPINVYDIFDRAPRDDSFGWEWEAAWTTQGARFLYARVGRVIAPGADPTDPAQRVDVLGYVGARCPNKWSNVIWPDDPATADPALKLEQDTYPWPADTPLSTRILIRTTH